MDVEGDQKDLPSGGDRWRLFYSPNSCALAVHIALEDAGVTYEAVRLVIADGQHLTPEYLRLNPLGRIPTLVTPHGALTEVAAILEYIAASFPGARLAPADAFARAKMLEFNAFVSSAVHPAFSLTNRPFRWANSEEARKEVAQRGLDTYLFLLDHIEQRKFLGPWALGAHYSIADPYLYVMVRWLRRVDVDLARYPRLHDHLRRMQERKQVAHVLHAQGIDRV